MTDKRRYFEFEFLASCTEEEAEKIGDRICAVIGRMKIKEWTGGWHEKK